MKLTQPGWVQLGNGWDGVHLFLLMSHLSTDHVGNVSYHGRDSANIMGSCSTLCGASGLVLVAAVFPEVYVGGVDGKVVALGEIP